MVQTIKCKHGRVFAACQEPECNSDADWKKDVDFYSKEGCTIEMVEANAFKFERCDECKEEENDKKQLEIIRSDHQKLVEYAMPEFVKAVAEEGDVVIMDISAFSEEENPYDYQLLGAAVWYACMRGKDVTVAGMKTDN